MPRFETGYFVAVALIYLFLVVVFFIYSLVYSLMTQQSSVSTSNRFSTLNEVAKETQQKKALSCPKKDNEDRPIPTEVNGIIWVKNKEKKNRSKV
jgi:uncharacterized membrane protein YhiD involved in acid resistance